MTIVTHPGQAHRDEFLACCLLLASGHADSIERRDPTEADMANPSVIVLDQGGEFNIARVNLDHHQLPKDHPPVCSITLVLEYLGINPEEARDIWGWLELTERMDSKGPKQTGDHYGAPSGFVFASVSPIETSVLRMFQDRSCLSAALAVSNRGLDILYDLMVWIGKEKLDYLKAVTERLKRLESAAIFFRASNDALVCDVTSIAPEDNPQLALEIFLRNTRRGDCAITISKDDRGDGYCLYRRNDDSRFDFSKLEGKPGIKFAHKNGFMAKTTKAIVHPRALLLEAMVS